MSFVAFIIGSQAHCNWQIMWAVIALMLHLLSHVVAFVKEALCMCDVYAVAHPCVCGDQRLMRLWNTVPGAPHGQCCPASLIASTQFWAYRLVGLQLSCRSWGSGPWSLCLHIKQFTHWALSPVHKKLLNSRMFKTCSFPRLSVWKDIQVKH